MLLVIDGEDERRHLRAALDRHAAWCRTNAVAMPAGLAALLATLEDTGGHSAPELADAAPVDQPELVTYEGAARRLSVSRRTITRWVRSGRLTAVGMGRGRRILVASLHPPMPGDAR